MPYVVICSMQAKPGNHRLALSSLKSTRLGTVTHYSYHGQLLPHLVREGFPIIGEPTCRTIYQRANNDHSLHGFPPHRGDDGANALCVKDQ